MLLSLVLSCTGVAAIHKTALLTSELFFLALCSPSLLLNPRDNYRFGGRRCRSGLAAISADLKIYHLHHYDSVPPPPPPCLNSLLRSAPNMCVWRGAELAAARVQIWPCMFFFPSLYRLNNGEQISSEHWILLIWYFGDLHVIIHHLQQIISSLSSAVRGSTSGKEPAWMLNETRWPRTFGPSWRTFPSLMDPPCNQTSRR